MEAQPASDPAEPEQPGTAKPAKASPLVGRTTREAIVQAEPRFAPVHAPSPDAASVAALARAEPGALVLVVLGTWCGDSRRELSRWFRALDAVEGELPFDVQYVAVDRAKNAPGESLDGLHIRYVPTFVVRRDAREVGRVVESAPRSIETAVAALLHGEASGTISDRADLP